MCTAAWILTTLKNVPLPFIPTSALAACRLVPLHEGAYRLECGSELFFVKWIASSNTWGLNELRVNRSDLLRESSLAPSLLHTIDTEQGSIAIWDWLEGEDLRVKNRQLLPTFFAELGRFHLRQHNAGQVYSPTTGLGYRSLETMLDAEILYLGALYSEPERIYQSALAAILRQGYVTLIHGDVHPGNMYWSQSGLHLVDWGYALNSLNLFDLAYVRTCPLNGDEDWWIINPPEAEPALQAYYAHCGMGNVDPVRTQWAVTLWVTLWALRNSLASRTPAAAMCQQNIAWLLQQTL